ncbi:MAG TPA: VOC family protein [Candidatus Krumholzibacteria bacterium]|nr:VOC family protein [Candidatus Krumholzibacteria bacterium]
MSASPKPGIGRIAWRDLTVADAERVRDFYTAVVGWKPEPVDMGGYADYNMTAPDTGEPMAGVCHARGVNTGIPAQWLLYFTVADLAASLEHCVALGGEVVREPQGSGPGRICIIRDPAGAVCALSEA